LVGIDLDMSAMTHLRVIGQLPKIFRAFLMVLMITIMNNPIVISSARAQPEDAAQTSSPLTDVPRGSPIEAILQKIFEKDYSSARSLLVPLLRVDDANALHIKAVLDENGWGGAKDLANAIRLYARAAEKGQVDAQFSLGELAYGRKGVRRDSARALEWYQLAANQGHPGAKSRIGTIYATGIGVKKDLQLGLRYIEEAATAGDRDAQFNIGVAYLNGSGRPQDYKKAGEWFLRAAQQFHPDAQFNLALLYDSPHLGAPDPQQTLYWMTAAAGRGLPKAYVALGLMIGEGRGAAKSERVAADWFERAALVGDSEGQFLYALTLAKGIGRPQRINESLKWLDQSLASNTLDREQISQRQALRKQLLSQGAKPTVLPARAKPEREPVEQPKQLLAKSAPVKASRETLSSDLQQSEAVAPLRSATVIGLRDAKTGGAESEAQQSAPPSAPSLKPQTNTAVKNSSDTKSSPVKASENAVSALRK